MQKCNLEQTQQAMHPSLPSYPVFLPPKHLDKQFNPNDYMYISHNSNLLLHHTERTHRDRFAFD